jgi:serine/threonine protein kinase
MEFLEHGDLQSYMDRKFEELHAIDITKQLLEGLIFMHQFGFTHRDLKPHVC